MENIRKQLIFILPILILLSGIYLITLSFKIDNHIELQYERLQKVRKITHLLYDQKKEMDQIIDEVNSIQNPTKQELKALNTQYIKVYETYLESMRATDNYYNYKYKSKNSLYVMYSVAGGTILTILFLIGLELLLIVETMRKNNKVLL